MNKLTSSYPILFVDTDPDERARLSSVLRGDGLDIISVSDPAQVSLLIAHTSFAVAVIRLWDDGGGSYDGHEGLAALRAVRKRGPDCQAIVLVEPKVGLDLCREAVLAGAAGFVEATRGDVPGELTVRITQACEQYDVAREEARELDTHSIFDTAGFAGQSRRMAAVLLKARRAAQVSDAPVLVEGESGTGKQLLSEAIHRMDPKRGGKAFLVVNCAAITGSLAESALFGHRRGAFTGATEDRPGYFRAARGGTILLDEIGELESSLQPKLLRVLQMGKVLPVGADHEESLDVRVIAATNRPLMAMVAEGKFRLDLYQRLNVISLWLPPLRQRPEDIPLLFDYFVEKYQHYYETKIVGVDPRVHEAVGDSLGSGNVRELENIVRRILTFKRSGDRIDLADLPDAVIQSSRQGDGESVAVEVVEAVRRAIRGGNMTLDRFMDECERAVLVEALREQDGSKSQTARRLGITRRTLYNKLSKHNFGVDRCDRAQ